MRPCGCQALTFGGYRVGYKTDAVQACLVRLAHHLDHAAVRHIGVGAQPHLGIRVALTSLAHDSCYRIGFQGFVVYKHLARFVNCQ